MLSKADNELLTRVGPGTPMGDLMRRYWLPACLSAEIPEPDGPPVRDNWLVLAQYDTADPKLTTRRIWLYGTESHRTALLLSYGAAGRVAPLPRGACRFFVSPPPVVAKGFAGRRAAGIGDEDVRVGAGRQHLLPALGGRHVRQLGALAEVVGPGATATDGAPPLRAGTSSTSVPSSFATP